MTFTPIPAGTRNWDVELNAALQDLQDQIESYTLFRPADHNLLTWTMDPALTQGAPSSPQASCTCRGSNSPRTAPSPT